MYVDLVIPSYTYMKYNQSLLLSLKSTYEFQIGTTAFIFHKMKPYSIRYNVCVEYWIGIM